MILKIIAKIPGQIIEIVSGAVEADSTLFTAEIMKMNVKELAPISGFFQATVLVGAVVVTGEVIGYFFTEE